MRLTDSGLGHRQTPIHERLNLCATCRADSHHEHCLLLNLCRSLVFECQLLFKMLIKFTIVILHYISVTFGRLTCTAATPQAPATRRLYLFVYEHDREIFEGHDELYVIRLLVDRLR